jgi:type VI secretion system secreted protein VgrG
MANLADLPSSLSLSVPDLKALFGTGLSQAARLIDIETAQASGLPDSLAVDRFIGSEGVNSLFQFEVDCLSVSTHIELAQFIGQEITLRVLLPGSGMPYGGSGGKRAWHGYCTAAAWLGADGGLARYRLTLSPFLSFLGLRSDAYIFQDKDALGICEELFKDYPQANVRYEVTQTLAKRAICTQYGETDLAFLTRLLASEGLSWRFEHEQSAAGAGSSSSASSNNKAAHAKHCLVIFDAASSLSQWPSVASLGGPADIRFHRAAATEATDTITQFSASRQAGANAVALSAWDASQLVAPAAEAASSLEAGALPAMAVYEGAGQRRYADAAAAQLIASLRLQALELPHKTFQGTSSARHLAAGSSFSLTQHEHYSGADGNFKVLHVTHAGANNLPANVAQLLHGMGQDALGQSTGRSGGSAATDATNATQDLSRLPRGTYRNQFSCVRAVVPVVPSAINAPLAGISAPWTGSHGPQTAIVVGVSGAPLTTERNHRVKVQFAWQRGASPLPGGLTELGSPDPAAADQGQADKGNAPLNETSGTWVRVAEAVAGPNWGSQFTPRLGCEVLIDFLDGDMDQPVIVGQLYNGVDTPPFAAGVDSGINHGGTISGWHSANHTEGYNQWVLDDTSGQLRMRLASSSAASQLNQGYLIGQAPDSAQRGSYRGAGFELRTDAWGVLRAPQGLLISTTTRAGVGGGVGITSTQMDTLEARAQLKGAQSLTDALQAAAAQAQALGSQQVKDMQTAQKLLLTRLDPKEQGSFKGQGQATLNGQTTQKTTTSGDKAGRDLDTAPEAAVEKFGAPLIVAEAPSSILMASPASTAIFAGEQLHIVTQGDSHYAAAHTLAQVSGKSSTLYTHEGGLEAVAANGPLSIQAHTDQLELLADKEVTVVSVNDSISINAKTKVVLKAGQTSITLDGGNITFACPGTFSVKGSAHSLDSGASSAAQLPKLADSRVKLFDQHFILKDEATGALLPNYPYVIHRADGSLEQGTSDEKGRTHKVAAAEAEKITIELGGS